MDEVAFFTLRKVAVLLLFISAGFLLRRFSKLPSNTGKVLSMLCTTIFTPAYTINNLSKHLTIETLSQKALLFGLGILVILLVIGLSYLLGRLLGKTEFERKSLTYAFAIPNYGYFGYPVVEGVFGEAMLSNMMVFVVPVSIATYSWGYLLFSREKKLTWKHVLLTPMIIAVVLGAAIGLSGLKLPGFVTDVISGAGSCMSPASMLLAGFVLGGMPLKKLLVGWKAYLITIVRLLMIPLIFGVPMYLLGLRGEWLLIPLVTLSLPLGLNLVVFPESYGIDATDNARMCFVSYLMCVLILPVSFHIIHALAF